MTTKATLRSLISLAALVPGLALNFPARAESTQAVTIRFAAKVGDQPFACGSNYPLGKQATPQTLSDFRFYVSDLALIDAAGKTIPVTLAQDGKWQYQTVALLDFEDKTGACANGTTEIRDRVTGSVPKGNYRGLKFTLGIPFALNHSDAALARSPLNLTGLWWNWQLGYKFARIDLQSPAMQTMASQHQGHGAGFPIHLGSTGCQSETSSEQPKSCNHPNRATVVLTGFNLNQNLVVADLERLVAATDLTQNQAKTAPGCMSEPEDQDCLGIMAKLGLPFMNQPASSQTFFRVE
ncbi:MAG: metallo-mystery pair system four-Cys motif protein [Aphanocapsa sp. GSE-SYN-MK-11-07L]|nr:metallo-mystery pair system four-Cys motif protein [Aphanocapsa sp. GSE-SYN-MK-11-07L]